VVVDDDCPVLFAEAVPKYKLWVRTQVVVGMASKQMFAEYISVLDGGARLIEDTEVGHASTRIRATRLYDAKRGDLNSVGQAAGLESVTQSIGRLAHIRPS
jgi:hypothetical protein